MISEAITLNTSFGAVTMWFEMFEDAGRMCCGLYKLEGHIDLPPKAWLRVVRGEVAKLEQVAKSVGCEELRIAGRDWSRVLPDFEPFDGVENGLRKVLH